MGSRLQGHPDRLKTPGIEVNTGSLGQGLSQGNGIALALKMDNIKSHVFVIVGDGGIGVSVAVAVGGAGVPVRVAVGTSAGIAIFPPTTAPTLLKPITPKIHKIATRLPIV